MQLDTSMSDPFSEGDEWFYYLATDGKWRKYGPYISEVNALRSRDIVTGYLSGDGCATCANNLTVLV